MESSYEVQPDVHVIPTYIPIPALGLLPANAYLVTGAQPYLVDTGLLAESDSFIRTIEAIMDPADLRWIYLTHTDPDHIGSLMPLLARAPEAKIVTTFIGVAKLQLGQRPPPSDRILLRNPGETIDLGDRVLSVASPPVFDAPETTMIYDRRLDALFSSDSFGGPLTEPALLANELPLERLRPSEVLWATVDSPWIHLVDRQRFGERLREIQYMNPAWIFSSHLPPARRMADTLCANLSTAPEAAPFVSPNQAEFEAMIAAVHPPAEPQVQQGIEPAPAP